MYYTEFNQYDGVSLFTIPTFFHLEPRIVCYDDSQRHLIHFVSKVGRSSVTPWRLHGTTVLHAVLKV